MIYNSNLVLKNRRTYVQVIRELYPSFSHWPNFQENAYRSELALCNLDNTLHCFYPPQILKYLHHLSTMIIVFKVFTKACHSSDNGMQREQDLREHFALILDKL